MNRIVAWAGLLLVPAVFVGAPAADKSTSAEKIKIKCPGEDCPAGYLEAQKRAPAAAAAARARAETPKEASRTLFKKREDAGAKAASKASAGDDAASTPRADRSQAAASAPQGKSTKE